MKGLNQNNQPASRWEKKRKHFEVNQDEQSVSRSLSELSISQQTKKKKKSTLANKRSTGTTLNGVNHHHGNHYQQQKNQQQEDNDSLSMNHTKIFKPRYLRVSDKIFKQMLSYEIELSHNTIQCLETEEKIEFVRQMTEATNNLYYFDLQRQLWQDYDDICMKEGVWTSRVSKSFAKQHHTCRTYGFPKYIIEKVQNEINQQFKHAIDSVQQYIVELGQNVHQWQPSIRPAILTNAINACVKNAHQRLRQEFDYKKKILTLNCNDHHWIKQFYHLQSSQEQVLLTR